MQTNIIKIPGTKEHFRDEHFLILSYVLSALIAITVYITGGTTNVYPNLMYLSIAIAAWTNGKKQGVIHATIASLLLGPYMPLDVTQNIDQTGTSWIIRCMVYITIAFIIGYFSEYYKQAYAKSYLKDKEIAEAQRATIYSLVKLSESRDDDTGAHIERAAMLCKLLANELSSLPKYATYVTDDYIQNIYDASLLHDIGKVGIPDSILLKPGKLSKEEFEIIKTHSTIGANTLIDVQKKFPNNKFLKLAISIAHFHHEKWDGNGYPSGISGEQIPLSARIMSLVDVYDALRSKRPYKEAYSHKKSLQIVKQGAGISFDPVIVNIFVKNEAYFKDVFEKYSDC